MATIFVADDNPHVHSMVEKSLGADGHEIAGTMDGAEALESIAHSKPDIVLLDSTLGGLNAFDTCREMLSFPGMEELRVVLLAGPLETIDSSEALQAGVSDVLQKPLDPEVLSALVGDGGDADASKGSKKLPAVDLLVHQALGDADSQQLRSAIHKQVEAVVNASIPSLIDHITDRLAEKLKPK